jgi:ubiquinone biosynthesis accessory factor UbiK
MFNSKTLDDLAMRISKAFDASPAKDVEKNVKALLQSGMAKFDFVTRQEFDVQKEVLARTREKVEALEKRVDALESVQEPATSASGSEPQAI